TTKQPNRARGIGPQQVEQIGRSLGNAEKSDVEARIPRGKLADRSRLPRLEINKPRCKTLFGFGWRGNMRPVDEPRGQTMLVRVALRGGDHATFCGISGNCAASLSPTAPTSAGSAKVARNPGSASPSLNSPPCSVATADARLNPSPEPGWVRLASRRTNRSTA